MIWSGLRIYWANDVYAFGIGGWTWFEFFPDGFYERLDLDRHLARGMAFHFSFAWLFVLNGLAYVAYTAVSGEWRHVVPGRKSISEAWQVFLHDLRIRKEAPPQGRYNAAQRLTYTAVIVLGVLAVLSGFAIYKPTQLGLLTALFRSYENARLVHFIVTISFVLFFVVHVLQVLRAGWGNFWSMITGYKLVKPGKDQVKP